jgi:hypothetical protein
VREVQILVNSFVAKFLTRNAFRGTDITWHCQPLYTFILFVYSLEEMSQTIRLSSVHLVKAVMMYRKITWRKLQDRTFSCWQSVVYCRLLKPSEFRRYIFPISSHTWVSLEICTFLWYHAVCSGNFLPTFRDNISDPSRRVKIGPIGCRKT